MRKLKATQGGLKAIQTAFSVRGGLVVVPKCKLSLSRMSADFGCDVWHMQ